MCSSTLPRFAATWITPGAYAGGVSGTSWTVSGERWSEVGSRLIAESLTGSSDCCGSPRMNAAFGPYSTRS